MSDKTQAQDAISEETESDAGSQMSPLKRWIRRFLIIFLVIAALFVAGLIMATAMGTHSAVRLGLQDYLSEVSNSRVSIVRYDKAAFYPSLDVDIGNIAFLGSTSPVSGARIGSVRLKMRFWDVFFGRPRAQILEMEEIFLPAGYITREPLTIDEITLERESTRLDGAPGLEVTGRYGATEPFSLVAEMVTVSENMKPSYFTYPEESRFVVEAPSVTMRGVVRRADSGAIAIVFSELGFPDHGWEGTAEVSFYPDETAWEFDLSHDKSRLNGAVTIDENRVAGTVTAPEISEADLAILPDFIALLSGLLPPRLLADKTTAVTIEIEQLTGAGSKPVALTVPLLMDENGLRLDHERFPSKPVESVPENGTQTERPAAEEEPEYNQ